MEFQQEEVVTKPYDPKIMKRLLGYAKPYTPLIALSVLMILAVTGARLLQPYLVKVAIDDYINVYHGSRASYAVNGVIHIGKVYLLIILISFILNYLQIYIMQMVGQRIIYNMRQQIFTHIQGLSLSFFDKNPVGRLVTRVTNDTDTLSEMYANVISNLFNDLFIIVGIVIMMFSLNNFLALISLALSPLIIVTAFYYRKYATQAYREVRVRLARINAYLAEHINGMKIVQVFHRENKTFDDFMNINRNYYKANMQQLLVFAIFRPFMDLLYSLSLALLIWYGGGLVSRNLLEFGVLYAFVNYVGQFFQPVFDLSEKYDILQAAMASSERIFMLLDTNEKIENPVEPVSLTDARGEIEFKNVWFAYNGDEWVLKDINFHVKPGETVAFVGATGAGKTSIISLLSRFYDIQKGEILIDGVNIKDMAQQDLRRHIGIVMQDVFIFTGDIKSNIRLNNDSITDEQVEEAARCVNADSFIRNLPGNYEAKVAERGATISSGQRQLLAFARALAFDPEILVLDEATANIDTETELLIQDALKRLTAGRTTLVVAHRLSTIQHADRIIVMHHGRIREMGTHQELLAKKGLYYQLYQLQYKNTVQDLPPSQGSKKSAG